MKLSFLLPILFVGLVSNERTRSLEGKWQLSHADSFVSFLTSERLGNETSEMQEKMTETIQFVLDNTVYQFKGDSVCFTDAGPGVINKKNGKWLMQGDTLFILESGRFKTHKYLISSMQDDSFSFQFIYSDVDDYSNKANYYFSRVW